MHARRRFLREARAGLFLHWGIRIAPAHTDGDAWEAAVTAGGWDPGYWVREARKLHARYLVLASFHSRLGYARVWPSEIPGSWSSRRDFLRELIDAAAGAHMRVILYITDDPQWHGEGLPDGRSWLDSAAYSRFKGRNVDLRTADGFGEFSYDAVVEVMRTYPDLGGFWIDRDNAYWRRHGLYDRIRELRPDFTLSNNSRDAPDMDVASTAIMTDPTPPYDHPQALPTATPRLVEADYRVPGTGEWWFTGDDSPVDTRLMLARYVANAGSSVRSLLAETAMLNGRFPPRQEAFNSFAENYLSRIWGAIDGTEGGGYRYGGLKPGFWSDGAHGVTTVSRSDPDQHYVHVLTPPSGGTLSIRDNGYRVVGVRDFRTGAAVAFSQGAGALTLAGITEWDDIDTVFAVTTAGREGVHPPSAYTMTATASAAGHRAAAVADGNRHTFWDSDGALPVSLRFDLGAPRRVQYLGLNQCEDPAGSARVRHFRVFFSGDGRAWGNPVCTGTLPSHRGVQFIDLPATTTRHVNLEVTSTWAAATDGARRPVRVEEAWVGSAYAGNTVEPPPSRFEAEEATISQGTVGADHAGFSGHGYVSYPTVAGGYVEWHVPAARHGPVQLRLRYANGTADNLPMDVTVNGGAPVTLNFPGTGSWDTWLTASTSATLVAGMNTVRATAVTAGGGPHVDYLEVAAG